MDVVTPRLTFWRMPSLPCFPLLWSLLFLCLADQAEGCADWRLLGGRDKVRFFGPCSDDLNAALKIKVEFSSHTFNEIMANGM